LQVSYGLRDGALSSGIRIVVTAVTDSLNIITCDDVYLTIGNYSNTHGANSLA
jgi:hypothetical protein